jgi:hypothetical protein
MTAITLAGAIFLMLAGAFVAQWLTKPKLHDLWPGRYLRN